MKTLRTSLFVALVSLIPLTLTAQDQSTGRPPGRPAPPIMTALDANQDGVVDASEIANAANALLTLDQNGDGQLTQDEIRPAGAPAGRGHGGKRGPRPAPDAE